jgi:MFS family permease
MFDTYPFALDLSSVSIMQLCSMCGLVSGGLLSDRFGRKKTLVASNTVLLAGWAVLYFATTFPTLLVGRGISGFGSGINLSASFLFLNEITLVRLRGAYGNLITLVVNLGFLFGLIVGGIAPFRWCIPRKFVNTYSEKMILSFHSSIFSLQSPVLRLPHVQLLFARVPSLAGQKGARGGRQGIDRTTQGSRISDESRDQGTDPLHSSRAADRAGGSGLRSELLQGQDEQVEKHSGT